ncbi:MAG: SGNH/GDSL hydrolase family protein [Gemmatimonadales bacterium]
MAQWTRNLLLAGGAMVVGLLVCELVLRLLGVSYPVYVWTDPVRGVAHIPGATGGPRQPDGHRRIEINGDGMRGPDIALKHPPGTFRIALLGDSFIEAFEVPFEQTVGEVLQRRLSTIRGAPVEVLNFGVGGYGTAQELLTLQHEVWKYAPDLILLAVTTGNDISNNYRPLDGGDYRPYYVPVDGRLVLDRSFTKSKAYRSRAVWTKRLLGLVQESRLVQLVNRVRHSGRKTERQRDNAGAIPGEEVGLRDEVQLPPTTPEWQAAWRVTEGILLLMRDECRSRRTPFAIVTLTRGIQVNPDPGKKAEFLRQLGAKDLYYPERRLNTFGERMGLPTFNLAPPMAKEAEQRRIYFHGSGDGLGTGHWNERGHRAAGELIAPWLAAEVSGRPNPKSPL